MTAKSFRTMTIIGLTIAGLVGSAGCATTGDTASTAAGTDLTISWGSYDKLGMDAVVAAYRAANPDVDVTVDFVDNDQYVSLLRTQLGAGTATDVVYVKPGDGNPTAVRQLATGGFLMDLSDRSWAAQYDPEVLPYTQAEGATYLMSPTIAAFLPAYNETAVAESGLAAPESWSGVLEFCDAARAAGKSAYALGAQSTWQNWVFPYMTVPTFTRTTDQTGIPGHDALFSESPAWQAALSQLQTMHERGCFQDDVLGTSFDSALVSVAAGDAFAVVSQISILGALAEQNPEAEFGVHPFPATDNPDDTVLSAALGAGAAVNADADNPEAALDFVDFLASPEGMNAYSTAMVGTVPSIANESFSASSPALALLEEYRASGRIHQFLDQDWAVPTLQSTLESSVQRMLGGQSSIEQALQNMDEAVTSND